MKKTLFPLTAIALLLAVALYSCNSQAKVTDEPVKIENTLQSVSYFNDTVGYDPAEVAGAFEIFNEAIDKIGYPDAGYKLWMIEGDSSGFRFMVEGFWPDQKTYDEIHASQLYIDARNDNSFDWNGLVSVEYHRFTRVK